MGLFAQKQQEPQDWAGLPSEPHGPAPDATTLETGDAITTASVVSEHVTSIAIPMPAPAEPESNEKDEN